MNKAGKMVLYKVLREHGIRMFCSTPSHHPSTSGFFLLRRNLTIPVAPNNNNDVGLFNKMMEKVGFRGSLRYMPLTLQHSGFRLYLSAEEASRYNQFYDYVGVPDTMTAWHKLTTLHIWLIMTRLATEGREGRLVRNEMIEGFLTDTKTKSKLIGKELKVQVKGEEIEFLHEQFLAALINYDEGLLGSDRQLAGSVWRCLFDLKKDVDPTDLETVVAYIRKQVSHLQKIDSRSMLTNGLIPFLPVHGNSVPKSTYECLEALKNSKLQFRKL